MLDTLIPPQFLYGDGTTQNQRPAEALAPGYAVPDARRTADLLALAQKYARFIQFFGENNNRLGTWEAFLPGQSLGNADETAPPASGTQWIADISAYLNDPASVADRPELQQRLSRPHLVLFLTFLQLLEPVREQLNGFTGRQLDYYYRQVLGMSVGEAVPDLAHVIVSLAEDVDQLFLEQGTALLAGKDSLGKDLVYRVSKSTGISRARLQRSAHLFVEKETLTIKTAREMATMEPDAGFLRMMQFAHEFLRPAEPAPTELPYLTEASLAEVAKQLFVSPSDAAFLLELQTNSKNGNSSEWDKAYFVLEQAFKDKTIFDRQQALKKLRESTTKSVYMTLLRATFGVPGLPALLLPAAGDEASPPAVTSDDELQALAEEYLTERELKLVLDTSSAADQASPADWDKVYVALERAARKQGNIALPMPMKEVWGNVHARDDARAPAGPAPLARLCFAVASPQLALAEGVRTLTLTCAFQPDGTARLDALREALAAQPEAITWALSGQKRWVEVEPTRPPVFGDFVVGKAARAYPFAVLDGVATKADKARFAEDEIGNYLVAADGAIYLISATAAPATKVSVTAKGKVGAGHEAGLYNAAQVYLHAMQVQFVRQATDPPVEAPGAADEAWPTPGNVPVLALQLNQAPPEALDDQRQDGENIYQLFRELKLNRLKVEVAVTGIRTLRLQNDYGFVNGKKPFEPFGPSPQAGVSLYLAHLELSSKRLDSLTLTPQWMGAPPKFETHYENYWKIRAHSLTPEKPFGDIASNDAFTAELSVIDQQVEGAPQRVTLFRPDAAWTLNFPAHRAGRPEPDENETDLMEWGRYFRLELKSPDFQHAAYSELLVQQAFLNTDTETNKALRQLRLNPPYTPLLKSLTAGYTASFEVEQGGGADADALVLHLGAFGYKALTLGPNTRLLPFPEYRSELLLGLSAVDTPQILPLFFQLAEATAQPDLTPGPLAWSYLAGNEWRPLGEAAVVSDTTNGLMNTGILELQLPIWPAGSLAENTWMSPKGLYWLKAGFDAPIDAISAIIAIEAQGISVVFDERSDNAADHLLVPLLPGSITKPRADIPEIARLRQPFGSSGGRPAETAAVFYNRVSERVRHKNRALTPWDYERLVLEEFPQIYKAKCLPAAHAPGRVDLIVIADIRGKMPVATAEPRAPAALLLQIRQFVERRAPAYAAVQVKNPSYMRVKVRAAIKIRPGYGEAHAVRQLEADLKRYLAPWAYEEGKDIIVGGKLYPDMIVNFIAGKSYVEFAASVVLFLSEDGQQYIPMTKMADGSDDKMRTLPPEYILVSAQEHIFDIIRESRFEERLLTGIGYAMMGHDFAVG
ncbi:baseplate J/gp47 family protein [Hymenobacter convexus]|uniref:baseplate J/gp47 family protein n=1 Tax=Hymenobacter sp. CA1UV-4 TaxID=3063782 RepID=UPI002713AB25|nr:baseplate J/gp47 family protein [Hymenobacter sp. CA1UV-4]MDO7854084.1 baseplate J/gp47 family protein [Hymenobacter sp. CA1UV-4]